MSTFWLFDSKLSYISTPIIFLLLFLMAEKLFSEIKEIISEEFNPTRLLWARVLKETTILKVDPETVKVLGETAVSAMKAGGKTLVKAGPPTVKFCIACFITAGAVNESAGGMTEGRIKPVTQGIDVLRGKISAAEVMAEYKKFWYGK
jgi:hypothetical protein